MGSKSLVLNLDVYTAFLCGESFFLGAYWLLGVNFKFGIYNYQKCFSYLVFWRMSFLSGYS